MSSHSEVQDGQMKSSTNWKELLQISSNIAILIGVILVVWELQQAQTLTRVQLRADTATIQADLSNTLMGESPQQILAKACLKPTELTSEEKMVLSQIFQNRFNAAQLNRSIERNANFGINYENNFEQVFMAMFNYEYGREYFERMKEFLPDGSEIRQIGDSVLERNRPSDCAEGSVIPWGF